MASKAKHYVAEGFRAVTPYLIIRNAAKAIDFYKTAFGATELYRMPMPDGRLGHAEIQIRDCRLMLADEMPEMNIKGPQTLGGAGIGLCLYVEDCDAVFNQAVANGAKVDRPLQNQFYGDRSGTVVDPFGHQWTIATHIEDLSPDELRQRMAQQRPPQ